VRVTAAAVKLVDDEVGAFLVSANEVVVDPATAARPGILRLVLLGPVIAILLQLRGLLVLHGSAVDVEGRAALFLGDTGAGKSTTAAALVRAGASLLVDDVVAIDQAGASPRVLPGAPYLRLMPESLLALGEDPTQLPRLRLDHEKRLQEHHGSAGESPVSLGAVYVLGVGPAVEVEPIAPADALAELLRHSYCADLLPRRGLAEHFSRCAALAAAAPVRRLGRPQALGRLTDLAARVRDDLAVAAE
jgi:hypothetical protein